MNGLKALVELASYSDRFEVVFSDVMMPGMSGIELGQQIGRLYPSVPVIVDLPQLTGEAFAQRDAVRSNCAGLR